MNQREILLAGLAPAQGAPHRPVQVQKLFFLLDRNIPELMDGPHFHFAPYSYGPFDKTVYDELEALAAEGFVDIVSERTWHNYKLSVAGQMAGEKLLSELPQKAQDYIRRISQFVRDLNFAELVSAVYQAYPEMRENSVFQG
jgi:uncharacterized protein YwgA